MPKADQKQIRARECNRILAIVRTSTLSAGMMMALSSSAYVGDYDGKITLEPVVVHKGDSLHFDCRDKDVQRQRIEVGVQPQSLGKIDWTLSLRDTVDNHDISIHVRKVERNKYDFDHDENIVITLDIDGQRKLDVNCGNDLPISKSPIYLQVQFDGDKVSVSAGDHILSPIGKVDYSGYINTASVQSPHEIMIKRHSSLYHPQPVIPMIYPDEMTVTAALSGCTDPRCGIWEYFDEEVETSVAVKGGRYRLALLPSESGGYDLIYMSGAETESFRWHAGAMKGHLDHTPFVDTFTLYWIDSLGKHIDDLTPYATTEGMIMTLVFPLQKAKFRFVRKN